MDITTVVVANALAAAAAALVLFAVLRTRRTYPGFGRWVAGAGLRTVGITLIMLQGTSLTPWLTVVAANLLVHVADPLLFARGLQAFRGRPARPAVEAVAIVVFLLAFISLTFVWPTVVGRIVVHSLLASALWVRVVVLLLRDRPDFFDATDRLLAGVLVVMVGIRLANGAYTLAVEAPTTALLVDASSGQGVFIMALVVVALLVTMAQVVMNMQRVEHDYRVAQRALEADVERRRRAEAAVRESEARFRRVADSAPVAIWVIDADLDGEWFNRAWLEFTGRTLGEELGAGWRQALHPEVADDVLARLRAHGNERQPFVEEVRWRRADGAIRWLQQSAQPRFDERERFVGFVGSAVDVTERRATEIALREDLEGVRRHAGRAALLKAAGERLANCETTAEVHGSVGVTAAEIFVPHPGAFVLWGGDDRSARVAARWGAPGGPLDDVVRQVAGAGGPEAVEQVCDRLAEGGVPCVRVVVHGRPVGALVLRSDGANDVDRDDLRRALEAFAETVRLALVSVSARETLREQAVRDALTGLFNRRFLDEALPLEIARARRIGRPLSVAMLDLDRFKEVNDAYGHDAGDAVLVALGELLRRMVRAGDVVCRYGGEEMTLILPDCAQSVAWERLEAVRIAVAAMSVTFRGEALARVTTSVGIATMVADETVGASELLARADEALYRAKRSGRNRVAVADAGA